MLGPLVSGVNTSAEIASVLVDNRMARSGHFSRTANDPNR